MAQTLKVTNLETNKGLIPIKLGQARVISSYKRIIHLIEIQHYEENLRTIQNNIKLVENSININKEYTYAFKNKIEILEHKAQELEQNINLLKPSRIKRGLANGLGSFIKDITGNLDQHDLEEISNAIHNLYHDQSKLVEQSNAQIAINQGMIDRVNYIHKYIRNSNKKISFELNRLANTTETGVNIIKMDQYIFKLISTIDTLSQHIDDILDALSSAKHRRISRHLLTNNEIHFINDVLSQDNIDILNPNNIYDLLKLQGYYNQSKIILSIQIPTFLKSTFNYYNIKPIPSKNLMITPIPSYNIILDEQNYQFILSPCNEVENVYYCTKQLLRSISHTCIPSIISQQPARCNHTIYDLEDEVIELLSGKIYIATLQELEFTSTCHQQAKSIKGQNLMEFDNCEINIQGITYSSKKYAYEEDHTIILPYHDVETHHQIPSLSIAKMTNWTIKHKEHIQQLQEHAISSDIQNHSTTGIITVVIITAVIYYIWKKYRKSTGIEKISEDKQPSNPQPAIRTASLWPSLRREELRSSTRDATP